MKELKKTRKNLWSISHGKSPFILGIFSCHMDSNYVMCYNIP
jgi:hypothetical protein